MKKMTKIISLIIVCLIVVLMPQNNYAIANAEESINNRIDNLVLECGIY